MCVTNIAKRRPLTPAIEAQMVAVTPSLISQRLLGNFFPLMQNAQVHGGSSTISTSLPKCLPQHQQTAGVAALSGNSNGLPPIVGASVDEKTRPKRRRKPQKPGKTAKLHDRHFVVHNYHDHASDSLDVDLEEPQEADVVQQRRGGVAISFPLKLHAVLDQVETDGLAHVISWMGHGRCFVIHKAKEFVDHVMPHYFRQTKLTSFQRQLNLYGFCRLTRGKDSGGYYHELFLRGKPFLCKGMIRTKVKGTKFKAASSPEHEPDFYTMPPVSYTPPTSDESGSEDESPPRYARRVLPAPFSDGLLACVNMGVNPARSVSLARLPQIQQVMSAPPGSLTSPTASSVGAMFPRYGMQSAAMNRLVADSILDEAVDELFRDDLSMQDVGEVDFVNVWDSSAFGGEDAVRDDTELGFLLERLLED